MKCMEVVEKGAVEAWWEVLANTGNTVCGRHPIGIIMAAIETIRGGINTADASNLGRFRFVRYERSSNCVSVEDSSVSYASGFAVV